MSCTREHDVDAHFAGRLERAEERRFRGHLTGCGDCQVRYSRQQLLSALNPRARGAKERLARGIDFGAATRRRWRVPLIFLGAAAALAAALAITVRPKDDGFIARGGGAAATTSIDVFRVGPGGKPEPVRGTIARDDELGFVYRNPTSKRRLLVFATDQHGHVYWYHPSWTRESDDPAAVAILAGGESHELGAVTAQPFDAEAVRVHALFTNGTPTTRAVEAQLKRGAFDPEAIHVEMSLAVKR